MKYSRPSPGELSHLQQTLDEELEKDESNALDTDNRAYERHGNEQNFKGLVARGKITDEGLVKMLPYILASTPLDDPRLLKDYYIRGKGLEAIAGEIGVSRKAVEIKLCRARLQLTGKLTEMLGIDIDRKRVNKVLNILRWHSFESYKWWAEYCGSIVNGEQPKRRITLQGTDLALLLEKMGFRERFQASSITFMPDFIEPYGHVVGISDGHKSYG